MRLDLLCRHTFSDEFHLDVDLSCDIRALALFGPSGSGKTTLLSTISGIFTPDIGRVAIDQQVLFDSEKKLWVPPERRSVGITPQHSVLFEHMRVQDNLMYGMPRRRKWKRQSSRVCPREVTFDSVVEILELGSLLHRYPQKLSGGERRRVAVGRALLSQPRLLILDEPLSALDRGLKQRILAYLKTVIDHWHIPTLIITHSPTVVHELADSVVVINGGRIIDIGSPQHLIPRTSFTH